MEYINFSFLHNHMQLLALEGPLGLAKETDLRLLGTEVRGALASGHVLLIAFQGWRLCAHVVASS